MAPRKKKAATAPVEPVAAAPAASGSPPEVQADAIDDAAQYRVRLSEKVTVGRVALKPATDTILRGDVLRSIQHAVRTYAKI